MEYWPRRQSSAGPRKTRPARPAVARDHVTQSPDERITATRTGLGPPGGVCGLGRQPVTGQQTARPWNGPRGLPRAAGGANDGSIPEYGRRQREEPFRSEQPSPKAPPPEKNRLRRPCTSGGHVDVSTPRAVWAPPSPRWEARPNGCRRGVLRGFGHHGHWSTTCRARAARLRLRWPRFPRS